MAFTLMEEMQRRQVKVVAASYNAALSACGRSHAWGLAFELMVAMARAGISADEVSYATAIAAGSLAGRWAQVLHLVSEAQQHRIQLRVAVEVMAVEALYARLQRRHALILLSGLALRAHTWARSSSLQTQSASHSKEHWEEARSRSVPLLVSEEDSMRLLLIALQDAGLATAGSPVERALAASCSWRPSMGSNVVILPRSSQRRQCDSEYSPMCMRDAIELACG